MDAYITAGDLKSMGVSGVSLKGLGAYTVMRYKNLQTGEILEGTESELLKQFEEWEDDPINNIANWEYVAGSERQVEGFMDRLGANLADNSDEIFQGIIDIFARDNTVPNRDNINNAVGGAEVGMSVGLKQGLIIGGIMTVVVGGAIIYINRKK